MSNEKNHPYTSAKVFLQTLLYPQYLPYLRPRLYFHPDLQKKFHTLVGSCSDTIGRIERGERNASLEIAIRLAHYLKMPVKEIFQIED